MVGIGSRPKGRLALLLSTSTASILDQGLFSGSQFFANVIFARHLSVEEYGAFTMAYSVLVLWFFFISSFHLEPITIYRHKDGSGEASGVSAHVLAALALFALFAVLAGIGALGARAFGLTIPLDLATLLAACLFTAIFWTLRQISYADQKPWYATLQTVAYVVGLLGSAATVGIWGEGTAWSAMLSLIVGAIVASAVGLAMARRGVANVSVAALRQIATSHARYGGWALPANMVAWFIANIFLVTLPLYGDVAGGARLKALTNLLLPFQQVLIGLSLVATPALARAYSNGDFTHFRKTSIRFLALSIAGGAIMSIIMLAVGADLFHLLYGAKYRDEEGLILLGLALPVLMAPVTVSRTIFRAADQPNSQLKAYLYGAVAVGVIAVPVGTVYGAAGAVIGMTLMQAGVLLAMLVIQRRANVLRSR